MSVIYGKYCLTGSEVTRADLADLAISTAQYGQDGTYIATQHKIGMVFQVFITDSRTAMGSQPARGRHGNMLTFDGRLDNWRELADQLSIDSSSASDCLLVLTAFERWGSGSFCRLVGDFAFALWSASSATLYLVRDHAGTRSLYFRRSGNEIVWSTYFETFFQNVVPPAINNEYLARLISYEQTADITPYRGICCVPAAHYVAICGTNMKALPYWSAIPDSEIRYQNPEEYDEQFRTLFEQAVRRRTATGERILAELSGGMDSSSIVCMADVIANSQKNVDGKLQTVSYFDDSEPNWNERPYVEEVERFRGKVGFHIDCSVRRPTYSPVVSLNRPYLYVCGDQSAFNMEHRFEEIVGPGKFRVILSGLGGDELLGGVPTSLPELANYMRSGRVIQLFRQAARWGIVTRVPLYQLLNQAMRYTIDLYLRRSASEGIRPPWILTTNGETSLRRDEIPVGIVGVLTCRPSAVALARAWWSIVGTLPHLLPPSQGCYEYRYPYLDRELVEFLGRIPRDVLVQPNRRRQLMRRAMRGIVPSLVIERRRKAIVSHGPIVDIRNSISRIEELFANPVSAQIGLVEPSQFINSLRGTVAGNLTWLGQVTKTLEVELWLRGLVSANATLQPPSSPTPFKCQD